MKDIYYKIYKKQAHNECLMRNIIVRTIYKTFYNDSTSVINHLLAVSAGYEELSENEKILAGFLSILHAPITIGYGLLLSVAGLLLTPIPKTSLEFSPRVSNLRYNESLVHVEKIKLLYRPHTADYDSLPVREAVKKRQEQETQTKKLYVWKNESPSYYKSLHQNGMTNIVAIRGHDLILTGILHILKGAFEPIIGLSQATFFAGKKIANCFHRHPQLDNLNLNILRRN